jgi:hypothetical protein
MATSAAWVHAVYIVLSVMWGALSLCFTDRRGYITESGFHPTSAIDESDERGGSFLIREQEQDG